MPDIYLFIEGQQQGPYSDQQIRLSLKEGLISNDQLAWHEGLAEWVRLEDLLEATTEQVFKSSLTGNTEEISAANLSPYPKLPSSAPANETDDSLCRPENRSTWKYLGIGIGICVCLSVFGLSVGAGIHLLSSPEIATHQSAGLVKDTTHDSNASRTKYVVPPSKIFDLAYVFEWPNENKPLSFSQLWADTQTYFNASFIFHGTIEIPTSQNHLYGRAVDKYNSGEYRQIKIVSLDKPPDGVTQDFILCYIPTFVDNELISLASKDESKHYSGYFILFVPTLFGDDCKQSGGTAIGEPWRSVLCQLNGYGPDLQSLQASIRAHSSAPPTTEAVNEKTFHEPTLTSPTLPHQ